MHTYLNHFQNFKEKVARDMTQKPETDVDNDYIRPKGRGLGFSVKLLKLP